VCGVCTSSLERDDEFKKFLFLPPAVDTSSILQHRPSAISPTAGPPLAAFQRLSEERREDDVGGLPATPRSALASILTRFWRLGQTKLSQDFKISLPPFCSIIAQRLTDPFANLLQWSTLRIASVTPYGRLVLGSGTGLWRRQRGRDWSPGSLRSGALFVFQHKGVCHCLSFRNHLARDQHCARRRGLDGHSPSVPSNSFALIKAIRVYSHCSYRAQQHVPLPRAQASGARRAVGAPFAWRRSALIEDVQVSTERRVNVWMELGGAGSRRALE
jgi:hypothetical protein